MGHPVRPSVHLTFLQPIEPADARSNKTAAARAQRNHDHDVRPTTELTRHAAATTAARNTPRLVATSNAVCSFAYASRVGHSLRMSFHLMYSSLSGHRYRETN